MSALSAVLASSEAKYAEAEQSLEVLEVSLHGGDLQQRVFREGTSNLRSKRVDPHLSWIRRSTQGSRLRARQRVKAPTSSREARQRGAHNAAG